jgi:hypothetical protein
VFTDELVLGTRLLIFEKAPTKMSEGRSLLVLAFGKDDTVKRLI